MTGVVLHFTKVLDVYEEVEEDGDGEQVDRPYWEKRANPSSMEILDRVVSMVPTDGGQPRVTWNKHHVALGTMGYNFCWFHPRKSAAHCHMHVRVTSDVRDTVVQSLEDAGIAASPFRNETVILKLRKKELEDNSSLVAQVLRMAERGSRGLEPTEA